MPARIDWIGRAHELRVRYLLKPVSEYKKDLGLILLKIKHTYPKAYRGYFKRIDVGAEHSVNFINKEIVNNRKIKSVEYLGEINKGISDVDLIINFIDKSKIDLSLKLYKKKGNFNLWNPTLETLFEHLTGKKFNEYLSGKLLKKYEKEMKSLKNRSIESKTVALFWVARAGRILAEFQRKNLHFFRNNLVEKLGYSSTIIAPIVDENGDFKELITVRPKLMKLLRDGKGKIEIRAEGISIKIYIDDKLLTSFAVYAQSGSRGRTGGLRIATWTPYF